MRSVICPLAGRLTDARRAQTSAPSSLLVRALLDSSSSLDRKADYPWIAVNARTPLSSPEAFATPVDALPAAFTIHFPQRTSANKRAHRRTGSEKLAKLAKLVGLGHSDDVRDERRRSVHFTVEREVAVEQQEHELKSVSSSGDVDLEAGVPVPPTPPPPAIRRPAYVRAPTSTMLSTLSIASSAAERCVIAPFATDDEVRAAVEAEEGRAEREYWSGG